MNDRSLPPKTDIIPGTLYDRLQFVLANYALTSPYCEALDDYLRATQYPVTALPACLGNPVLFFYTRKNKKHLYCVDGFYFADTISYRITHRTFPSFLRCLDFAEGPAHLRHRLLEELEKLVRQYPYTERSVLTKKAFKLNHLYTAYIEEKLRVSPIKNLYIPQLLNSNSGNVAPFPYETILSGHFEWLPVFSKVFMRQYLGSIARNPGKNAVDSYNFPEDCLIFYNSFSSGANCRILTSQSAPQFHKVDIPIMLPIKILDFVPLSQKIPAGAVAWLFHLTGGNLHLLKQLADLLARAASSFGNKKISVICSTQNLDILLDFLCSILNPLVSTDILARLHSPWSLNNYCRASGLLRLFISQETGAGVVFAKDTAISDTARPILNKLLSGRPISISVPGFPKQILINRNHIIVVSSSPDTAARLSKDLRAPLLDFSKSEIPVQMPIDDLSDEDIQWLRCAFIPYGLLDLPSETTSSKRPTTTWVEDFLKDCCCFQPGILRSRDDFYADYCACYTARFPGKQPPLTLGRFTKAVKQVLGKGIYRNAGYRKVRNDQRMYFDGIVCIKSPCDIHPEPEETLLEQFKTRIKIIDTLRPMWISDNDDAIPFLPKSTE